MQYNYSQLDHDNFKWFANDMTKATLSEIQLCTGNLRGLHPFELVFSYPISVISGPNGSGKSTILAMVACAYHNGPKGFRLPERRLSYYRYSDFFIQSSEEVPPEGIVIRCRFMHNNWRKSAQAPNGIGNLWQKHEKKKGGKWSNYSGRVRRNVVFLGIQRVVPPSEKTVSKSYRHFFTDGAPTGVEDEVKTAVGRVLTKQYDRFWLKSHGKYRLPVVDRRGQLYSGFNMGAGENALFEIFLTIFSTPPGTLLVIDEIELGLHESAQRNLLNELKRICDERHIQVICTTHSAAVLASVPPEARFFVQSYSDKTVITTGISPEYAAGQLAVQNSNELDIYVEDGVAAHLVESALPLEVRRRANVIPIGSATAIIRQLSSRFKDRKHSECMAVLDGDQAPKQSAHLNSFLRFLETVTDSKAAETWFKKRVSFLPGPDWPEKWLLNRVRSVESKPLARLLKVPQHDLASALDAAATAPKHDELRALSARLVLDQEYLTGVLSAFICERDEETLTDCLAKVKDLLL